jgi:hypothetical protein
MFMARCFPTRSSRRIQGTILFLGAWLLLLGQNQAIPMADSAGTGLSPFLDLTAACLVLPAGMTCPENKAAQMLVEEVEKRSQIGWPIASDLPASGKTAVILGRRSELERAFPALANKLKTIGNDKPEGYTIVTLEPGLVIVAGNDQRGVLYGAGRLLRLLTYRRGQVVLDGSVDIVSAPRYRLRGHQLGFRPKTNSYDGWTVPMWEQYIRELVIFGVNAIELIPPRSDDDADSPHFPLPPMQMMVEMSRLAAEYGLECWVWYPAMDKDYSDPVTVTAALKEWGDVLRQLPRVDAVFVPGGDPGHTPPKVLMPMLEKQAAQLRQFHPGAQMWISPQGFDAEWMEDFYAIMKTEPAWLDGVVFGPQQSESLEELRARIPKRYPIRFYPDITHTIHCQFPVPDWDYAYVATLNREPINPRPLDEAAIFRRYQPLAEYGFLTYSEGCNDDLNKCIWSCLGWNPDENVTNILRDYSHFFIGDDMAEGFAQGLLALERNWRGTLISNEGVYTTLLQFQAMEKAATPQLKQNWRFQQALYRAYYDATDRARLLSETLQEQRAGEPLSKAKSIGSFQALAAAETALASPDVKPAAEWRARVFELAEALFQSIHMQLSVEKYQAIAIRRGANLDLIDFPLNNAQWLRERFAEIRSAGTEPERLQRIDEILNWTDPGPGGFYDDLGNTVMEPHLVRGESYSEDPAFLHSPFTGFGGSMFDSIPRATTRVSSATHSEVLNDQPLEMLYRNLDKYAHYRLRVVYGNEHLSSSKIPVRLVANERYEIHPFMKRDRSQRPVEFDVPTEATASGELRLTWTGPAGQGGNGRGVQVAEVWLIRAQDGSPQRSVSSP